LSFGHYNVFHKIKFPFILPTDDARINKTYSYKWEIIMEWVFFAIGMLVGMILQTVLIKWISSGGMVVTHKHVKEEIKEEISGNPKEFTEAK